MTQKIAIGFVFSKNRISYAVVSKDGDSWNIIKTDVRKTAESKYQIYCKWAEKEIIEILNQNEHNMCSVFFHYEPTKKDIALMSTSIISLLYAKSDKPVNEYTSKVKNIKNGYETVCSENFTTEPKPWNSEIRKAVLLAYEALQ